MAVLRCRISEYENFTIVSPSRTQGHTITPGFEHFSGIHLEYIFNLVYGAKEDTCRGFQCHCLYLTVEDTVCARKATIHIIIVPLCVSSICVICVASAMFLLLVSFRAVIATILTVKSLHLSSFLLKVTNYCCVFCS